VSGSFRFGLIEVGQQLVRARDMELSSLGVYSLYWTTWLDYWTPPNCLFFWCRTEAKPACAFSLLYFPKVARLACWDLVCMVGANQ